MNELKVIEKFMEDNGLEPYDAFDVDGEFKQCNPLYFNENLKELTYIINFIDE